MTRPHWSLFGADGLGLAIAISLIFFCPKECR
jgi:hypothetical protein